MTGTTDTHPIDAGQPCDLTELVRGSDQRLVEQMTPLVRRQCVALDLESVQRIDAAGVAALIQIYRIASESGHSFTVSHASPHVREILALVGLDRILLSHIVNANSHPDFRCERHAA